MEQNILLSALIQQKKIFALLTETAALTEQLAGAVDRDDEVSVQVVLSMRQEPLTHLSEMQNGIRSSLLTLAEEDAIALSALLSGGTPASPAEQPLADQVAANARLLERISTLDRRISLKVGGSESYYNKYRE